MILSERSGERVEAFSEAFSEEASVAISSSSVPNFTDLVVALEQTVDVADVDILTDSDTVSELRGLFFTTSRLVDYILEDDITIRAHDSPSQSLVITEDSVGAVAGFPEANPTVVETTDESVVGDTLETFEERFDEAAEVTFQKPGYTALLNNLEETFDESLVEDFKEALDTAKEPATPGLEIGPVFVSLLVGGFNEVSFYQLSRCGQDVRLASPANFSRKKRELEDVDLIETESIPSDVGWPPQRLLLGGAVEVEVSIEDVIATATHLLSRRS